MRPPFLHPPHRNGLNTALTTTTTQHKPHKKKPKVFLDVVESVHLLVNSDGAAVLSEVHGTLKMRCYLSGMPECKLGLNDKVRGAAH